MKKAKKDTRTIRTYTEKDGNIVRIVKAKNGCYFNEYTSHGSGAGPFKTFKDAKSMLEKHRPTAKSLSTDLLKSKNKGEKQSVQKKEGNRVKTTTIRKKTTTHRRTKK